MSLRKHVSRLQQHLNNRGDYVWISEDALDNALQRFSHTRISRRHVGLAPGPLEARKRASKRRMMNLAQVGDGAQLDPNLCPIVGVAPEKAWQWQSPSPTSLKRLSEPLPLPRWLTNADAFKVEEDLPGIPVEEDQLHLQRVASGQSMKTLRANSHFLEDLKCCNNLASLRIWAAKYNLKLRRYPRLAFRQLCEGGQTLETLFEALGESSLNNSDNLDFLLRQQTKQPLSAQSNEIGQLLKRTLFLGQWSEAQIALIVDFVLHFSRTITDERLKCGLIREVFEGLQSSTVFSIKDLNQKKLGVLLKAVTSGTSTRLSHGLGLRIIKALEPSQSRRLAHSISLFLQEGIEAQSRGKLERYEDAIPRSFAMLGDLPLRTSSAVIIATSRALVKHAACLPESNVPLLRLLDHWWSWIRRSDIIETADQGSSVRQLERLLTGKSMVVIATYLRHYDDFAIAHFMLRREFLAHLDLGDRCRAIDLFRQICKVETDVSPYVAMIRAAHHFSSVSERTLLRMFKLLLMLQKSKYIASTIVGLRSANIRISEAVIVHTIKTGLHWKYHGLDQIFAVYRELPLEKCPELAERMIRGVGYHPSEALKRYTRRHPGVIPGCREPLATIKARSQLLQRMAVAYSYARHLTSHRAFFYVSRCYIYHSREKLGPLGKGMILALTRSGIVRPLECGQWVSTMRVRWLLELIRKFEGGQVANEVDRAVYEWRGLVVRRIRAEYHRRKRARYGVKEPDISFSFRRGWVNGQGYASRILKPLERRTS